MLIIRNLNAATKYYVRVLARTKVGGGNYSKTKGKYTIKSECRIKVNTTPENKTRYDVSKRNRRLFNTGYLSESF